MAGSLNPLDLAVRSGTDAGAVARSFASELIERSHDERERFWNDWSESMITGGVAWMLVDLPPAERSLSRLFDLFNQDDPVYALAKMLDAKEVTHRSALSAFTGFLQLSERETRPSVLASTQAHLRLFDSDAVRRVTDTTSFDLDALVQGKPMSLYIIVPPYRLTAYRSLLRMWLSGLFLAFTLREKVPEHRTLMLCDEIGNLGRIDAFVMAATLMRSWGVTLWSFWQNWDQLQLYKPQANTIVDNAGVVQVFGARNQRAAGEFAAMLGGVAAETVLNLGPREQLLLIEGGRPMRCQQARYYEDREFTGMGR